MLKHLIIALSLLVMGSSSYAQTTSDFWKEIKKQEKSGDYYAAGSAALEAGNSCFNSKNYTDAQLFYSKSKEYFLKANDKNSALLAIFGLSDTYAQQKKYSRAIDPLEEGLKYLSDKTGASSEEEIYRRLYQYSQKAGDTKKTQLYQKFYNNIQKEKESNTLLKQKQKQMNELQKQNKQYKQNNEQTQEELSARTQELLMSKDSLAIMDLINQEHTMKIELLNKEKEFQKQILKEKEISLENEKKANEEQALRLKQEEWLNYSLMAGLFLMLALAGVVFYGYRQQKKARHLISEQHESITQSITYAQRIQQAMLPHEKNLNYLIKDSFILFKPRDIVSGDFYWFYNLKTHSNFNEFDPENKNESVEEIPSESQTNKILIAAVDCTGHGVPGAFMSMIGYNLLNEIVGKGITEVDKILEELNRSVRFALQQYKTENNDGMDMALCLIDKDRKELHYAGAKNPLIYIQNGELQVIKGDIHPIGGTHGKTSKRTYTKHTISIAQPTTVYLFSDGYQDQFGGPENKKFMIKKLKEVFTAIHQDDFSKQKATLEKMLSDWKGTQKQMDDVLVMGMKVGG